MKFSVKFIIIVFSLSFSSLLALPVRSQEKNVNDKRIQKLEEENKALRDIVEQLQKRLERLESKDSEGKKDSKKKKSEEKKSSDSKKDGDRKEPADSVEKEKSDDKNESWLPSLNGESFRLGGRYQIEFFDPEAETLLRSARTEAPGGSFNFDELRIYIDADFKNNIRFSSAFDIEGEDEGVVEAYVDFEDLPLQSELRVGLQKYFFRPSRFTETYPLPGIAFWRDRDLGVTWKGDFKPFYSYLAILNGNQLSSRRLNEDDTGRAISRKSGNLDLSGGKEFLAGAGFKYDFNEYGKIDLLGYGLTGDLSDEDIVFLQTEVPGYGQSFSDRHNLAGVNLEYDIKNWDFFAQAISGRDGAIDRFAWYAELSYKFEFEGLRYLNSIRPLARYGELDIELTPRPYSLDGSLTWDREQWLFGLISELSRNVNFRAEYALNEEDTGGPNAQNNELLFQLEVLF